jgi:hypothetical protein
VTGRDRIVILVVLAVAAVVGSWLLVISPQRDKAAKLADQVTSVQNQVAAARNQLLQARLAQNTYRSQFAQLARLGEAVPGDDDVPSLIYQLQHAASGARVDFRGIQAQSTSGSQSTVTSAQTASLPPDVTIGAGGFPTEQFTFTFQGTYFQLVRFLNRVQNFVIVKANRVGVSGRLISLNSISLAAASNGFPQIAATISANTYLMPAASASTTSGTSGTTSTSAPATASASSSSGTPAAAAAAPLR